MIKLTEAQVAQIRKKYRQGFTGKELAKLYDVNMSRIYKLCDGISKQRSRPTPVEKPVAVTVYLTPEQKEKERVKNITKLKLESPHLLLYMFTSGQLDDDQVYLLKIKNNFAESQLKAMANQTDLAGIVRDAPLLLLQTMVWYETTKKYDKTNRKMVAMTKSKGPSQPWENISKTDSGRFDPQSDICKQIAALAIKFALEEA